MDFFLNVDKLHHFHTTLDVVWWFPSMGAHEAGQGKNHVRFSEAQNELSACIRLKRGALVCPKPGDKWEIYCYRLYLQSGVISL